MGVFSGLSQLGLGKLAGMSLYEEEEKEKIVEKPKIEQEKEVAEEELLLDKTFRCPVCDRQFKSKTVKVGKAKLLSVDSDLRAKYQTVDTNKYDCIACDTCGYAALSRFFDNITPVQQKLVRQNISPNFNGLSYEGNIYSYDEAILRFQLALANAVVKKSRASERAYICLKLAWLVRGKAENLNPGELDYIAKKQALALEEQQYIENAYDGFRTAMQKESFPICGMEEFTFLYLVAELARKNKDYDVAQKLAGEILISRNAKETVKNKTRELMDNIRKDIKKA